ncbi:MAG: hypothetical protein WDA02_03680 [Saccharofermentanales bacterium]|jgi:hypothetical protein
MKTLKRDNDIIRVKDNEVDKYLKSGYNYTQKSVWKKEVRDVNNTKRDKKDKK